MQLPTLTREEKAALEIALEEELRREEAAGRKLLEAREREKLELALQPCGYEI